MGEGGRGAAGTIRGLLLVVLVAAVGGWVLVALTDSHDPAAARVGEGASPTASPGLSRDARRSTSAAPSAARVLVRDGFETDDGALREHTVGDGRILAVHGHTGRGVRVVVPRQSKGDAAWLSERLDRPARTLTASAWFKVRKGGCDPQAFYSRGNIPFFRFFDAAGDRMVSLFRINGECSETGQVYLQHSGGYYQSTASVTFGDWHRVSLTASIGERGRTALDVDVDGRRVYATRRARLPGRAVASVGVGNDVAGQKGVFVVDDVVLSTQQRQRTAGGAG